MGYEVTYFFHERLEDGGYDRGEKKQINRKVGEPFEDVPLEKLASTIMSQLARRDVWVVGVEIIEYSKKEISFKETKGGIIIKNKKFVLDEHTAAVTTQDVPAPQPAQVFQHPHEALQVQRQQQAPMPIRHPHEALQRPAAVQVREQPPGRNLAYPHEQGQPGRPGRQARQKRVVFAPSDMDQVKQQRVRGFTVEKEYPVLSERMNSSGVGMTFLLLDDVGMQQEVSDEFFIPVSVELYADKQLGFSKPPPSQENGGNLDWKGVINDAIPDVRRK